MEDLTSFFAIFCLNCISLHSVWALMNHFMPWHPVAALHEINWRVLMSVTEDRCHMAKSALPVKFACRSFCSKWSTERSCWISFWGFLVNISGSLRSSTLFLCSLCAERIHLNVKSAVYVNQNEYLPFKSTFYRYSHTLNWNVVSWIKSVECCR